ncbi:MAG TPA: outer membrane beta-barrel protein [Bacteroidia bacterium]|jgi:hypothetical protein|nr:outer membrane beta-barrel protein [Bacteroidia bacterium]
MKRTVLLLFPLLAIVSAPKAQTFKVGALAGVAITDVSGMDQIDYDNDFYKFGFTAGGFVNTKLTPKSSMQLEITYTQRGSQQPPDSTHMNAYYTLILNYIDINLIWKRQLHLGINKKQTDKWGFEAGATFGTLVYSNFTAQSIEYSVTGLSNFELSAMVGLYYNFSPKFYFSGTYSNSIIPVIGRNGGLGLYSLNYGAWNAGCNLAFQLTFGYAFNGASEPESNSSTPPPPAPSGGN